MSDTNNQTLSSYDKTVDKYVETSPQTVEGHNEIKNWIDKNLHRLTKQAKILEIGSGTGKDADYVESQGFHMELTDGSRGFVDYLNDKGKQARLLNALEDDYGQDYDMIFADAVFLHFTPQELSFVLRQAHKALKPGGRLVFSLKVGDGEEITDRKLGETRYFCYWIEEDIRKLLENSGFGRIEIESSDDYRGKSRPDWLLISTTRQ